MRLRFIFLYISFLFSKEWFITNYEYGKMLYNNPRGISCARCHNKNAKGRVIATYKVKNKIKKIIAPNIQKITFEQLKERLLHYKKLSIMPRYNYLTEDEIEGLYIYIKSKEKK